MFQELGEFQTETLGDPSTFWAYKNEDFVGLCATIGFSRGGGSTAATIPMRVIIRVRGMSWAISSRVYQSEEEQKQIHVR